MYLLAPHYYDICILGLAWLSEDEDPVQARSLSPMIYTLRELGLIEEKQRRAAMRDAELRRKLLNQLYICHDKPGYSYSDIRDHHIQVGKRHLVLALPKGAFERRRVLWRNGYRLQLTNAGYHYAEKKTGPYASIVTQEQFVAAWREMRARIAELMSLRRGQRSTALDKEFEDLEYEVDLDA